MVSEHGEIALLGRERREGGGSEMVMASFYERDDDASGGKGVVEFWRGTLRRRKKGEVILLTAVPYGGVEGKAHLLSCNPGELRVCFLWMDFVTLMISPFAEIYFGYIAFLLNDDWF